MLSAEAWREKWGDGWWLKPFTPLSPAGEREAATP